MVQIERTHQSELYILSESCTFLNCFQIENAFTAGYDPALELEHAQRYTQRSLDDSISDYSRDIYEPGPWTKDLRRKEQDLIDSIVTGKEPGRYFMLLGPKVGIFCLFFYSDANEYSLKGFRKKLYDITLNESLSSRRCFNL